MASSSEIDIERELTHLRYNLSLRDDGAFIPTGLWESDTLNSDLTLVGQVLTKRSFNFEAFKGTLMNLFRSERGLEIHKIGLERCMIFRFLSCHAKSPSSLGTSWERHIGDSCHLQYVEGFVDPGEKMPYGPWLHASKGGQIRPLPFAIGSRVPVGRPNFSRPQPFWSTRGADSASSWHRAPSPNAMDNPSQPLHSRRESDVLVLGATHGLKQVGANDANEVVGNSVHSSPLRSGDRNSVRVASVEVLGERDLVSVPISMLARGRGGRTRGGRGGRGRHSQGRDRVSGRGGKLKVVEERGEG
ncbi:hypothetical protein BUALT_Bualt07G0075300 [Buddleja alternifolia]|uniref:Uncharacterized protein n=1 Tax=Buddleja alternifolia TaxID=168488 RepID=A0AAV6XFT6_9LAMI|nr:hypothetical protein BUALT_Bualt07G0075300 [Buddleja alternifolia]